MVLLPKITFFILSIINTIDCDVMDDIRYNNVNNFMEIVFKQFRHHEARFRPFLKMDGSPISAIRIGRSIREDQQNKFNAECVYAFESLLCAGVNQDGAEVKVKCDARKDMKITVARYALSDLRVLKTGSNSTITKMYMLSKKQNTTSWINFLFNDQLKNRNILSVHSTDSLTDQGLTILEPGCWNDMVQFFKMIKTVNEITVESQWGKISKKIKVIAYLNFM